MIRRPLYPDVLLTIVILAIQNIQMAALGAVRARRPLTSNACPATVPVISARLPARYPKMAGSLDGQVRETAGCIAFAGARAIFSAIDSPYEEWR